MKKHLPASYPHTSISETSSIDTLSYILNKRVISHLASHDKVPNIDGYLEIVNEKLSPIGKLEVQVKTLEPKNSKSPKYQCSNKFLGYCADSTLPVLLIVVDSDNAKAYWIHMSRPFVLSLFNKMKGKSINVNIPKKNIVSRNSSVYLTKWHEITQDYQSRVVNYGSLKEAKQKISAEYNALKKLTNPALGNKSDDIKEIQFFIDTYNSLLDKEFSLIKSIYFRNCWKFGFAYEKYEENHVTYSLYPIEFGVNDVQIKMVDNENLSFEDFNTHSRYFKDNPIKNEPVKTAYETIHSYLKPIIDNRSLMKINNEVATEYLFSIIDIFGKNVGLDAGIENITLGEINSKFGSYYPEYSDSRFSRSYIEFLINYLNNKNITSIKRFYPRKKYPSKGSWWLHETLTKHEFKETFVSIFKYLPTLYDSFIDDFFPDLKNELCFFNDFNLLIINIKYPESEGKLASAEFIYLKSISNVPDNRLEIYLVNDETPPITFHSDLRNDNYVDSNGNQYSFISASSGVCYRIFNETPLFEYLYLILRQRLENYFGKFLDTLSLFNNYSEKRPWIDSEGYYLKSEASNI